MVKNLKVGVAGAGVKKKKENYDELDVQFS